MEETGWVSLVWDDRFGRGGSRGCLEDLRAGFLLDEVIGVIGDC
jgi:hypothetical protein